MEELLPDFNKGVMSILSDEKSSEWLFSPFLMTKYFWYSLYT